MWGSCLTRTFYHPSAIGVPRLDLPDMCVTSWFPVNRHDHDNVFHGSWMFIVLFDPWDSGLQSYSYII